MKLKWRNFPAIITLLAGFITCVITTVYQYPLNIMLWMLILVMTVFYILGISIRAVIIHFLEIPENKDDNPDNTEEDAEDKAYNEQSETDEQENIFENPDEQMLNN